MKNTTKINTNSVDIKEEQTKKLKQLFPEVFNEEKVDFEKLKRSLGENIDTGRERYGMNWPGKAQAIKVAQLPSNATLKPDEKASVDFDKTQNLFIEGDNLEVLKLLQKSYFGKIKMCYLDPPYNTGKEFIYPDKYEEGLQTYLQYTGQIDAEGKKFSTNVETDGRFHSKWMNMMWPRLFLARNLLTEDGVIFISIDDNEVVNLRKICDEIFGEENLISIHNIQVRYGNKSLNERKDFQELLEYVLIYTKNKDLAIFNKPNEEYSLDKFNLTIKHSDKPTKSVVENGREVDVWGPGSFSIEETKEGTVDKFKETWISGSILTGTGHGTMYLKVIDKRRTEDGDGCLYRIQGIGEDGLGYRYYTNPRGSKSERGKMYTKVPIDVLEQLKLGTAIKENPIINSYDFSADFGNIRHEGGMAFNGGKKPIKMIKQFINYLKDDNFFVLDFFAGSASSAHAVMQSNMEDGGNRKFIMVQLPEGAPDDSEAYRDGFKDITEIGEERIRRAGKKILEENKGKEGFDAEGFDKGFKVFKLDRSNFSVWNGSTDGDIQKKLELHVNNTDPKSKEVDILYEILVKAGFELTEKIEEIKIDGRNVYSVSGGQLLICLDKLLDKDFVRSLAEKKPKQFICLNSSFKEDADLTNTAKILENNQIEFRTI